MLIEAVAIMVMPIITRTTPMITATAMSLTTGLEAKAEEGDTAAPRAERGTRMPTATQTGTCLHRSQEW